MLLWADERTRVSCEKPTFELSKLRANGNRRRSPGESRREQSENAKEHNWGMCKGVRRENAPYRCAGVGEGEQECTGAGEGESERVGSYSCNFSLANLFGGNLLENF